MLPPRLMAEIIADFRVNAAQRLERIEGAWLALAGAPADAGLAATVCRELHTLKGDASLVGFGDVRRVCHELEELHQLARSRGYRISAELELMAIMGFHFVGLLLRRTGGRGLTGIDVDGFLEQMEAVVRQARAAAQETGSGPAAAPGARAPVAEGGALGSLDQLTSVATTIFLEHFNAPHGSRARLRDAWVGLVAQIAALNSTPLAPRLEKHAAGVAALARDLGKRVAVDFRPDEVVVAREVAAALDTAVLHVMRNAVDHGIEGTEGRIASCKGRTGEIRVRARAAADLVEVTLEDDGGGIDFTAVRRRARELGLASDRTTEAELLGLICRPHFSTRAEATEVSGRGIGLDAATEALERVGGSLTIDTDPGFGTIVTLRAPRAGERVRVHRFAARGGDVPLAVPETWRVEAYPAGGAVDEVIDPLAALGIEAASAPPCAVSRLRQGGVDLRVRCGAPLGSGVAERICPRPDAAPVEVVRIDGAEALLLRPQHLRKAHGAVADAV